MAPTAEALTVAPLPAPGTDEADAALCALTAAYYDNQVRRLGQDLLELWLGEDEFAMADRETDGAEFLRQEGWTYFPNAALS